MAKTYEAGSLISPEEKLARRIAQKHSLTVPVNTEKLLGEYADIVRDLLPGKVDAIAIDTPAVGGKPKIYISSALSPKRMRFTCAHELAHIVIPWHLGVIGCHPSALNGWTDHIYGEGEKEANRFASELLLPAEWLRGVVAQNPNFEELWSAASVAEASIPATLLALGRVLEPGFVLAITEQNSTQLSVRSAGTAMDAPTRGAPLDLERFARVGAKHEQVSLGVATVHRWKMGTTAIAIPTDDPKQILERILVRHGKIAARHSISGVIGAANSMYKSSTIAELADNIRQRLVSQPKLRWLVSDPEFEALIAARAAAIIGRKPK